MDLAGLDDEVDRVVGDQRAEALGDAAQFELHATVPPDVSSAERTVGEVRARQTSHPPTPCARTDQLVGWLGEVILILPEMMSALTWCELGSAASPGPSSRSRGTAPGRCRRSSACRRRSRSGRCPPAACVEVGLHRAGQALGDAGQEVLAVLRGRLTQPSVSTQITLTLPPEACAAAPAPRPGATGDREDDVGALLDERLADLLALVLVGERGCRTNVPPFWFFSSQPSTWTFLLFCCVVVLHALPEAVHVDRHRRDVRRRRRWRPCRSWSCRRPGSRRGSRPARC